MGDFVLQVVIPLVICLLSIIPFGWLLLEWRRRHYLGKLQHITTESCAYNRQAYGHILDWDKHSLKINQQPIILVSGEFHYWRIPDKSRWESILKKYREAGLNCIRIYFHWGFHSQQPGQYDFSGNKDVDYLLELCEQIGLFVMAAPGPYICAETQGGGHPTWLLQKRHIRIRHSFWPLLNREYDPNYSYYCREWFQHLFPILKKHQITENRQGCLIALQIENEMFECVFGVLPVGLHDDMRYLAKSARELGMTVPLFTNDGFEEGSFNPHSTKNGFGIDLYGFDKYVIFAPVSSIASHVFGSKKTQEAWPEWNPKEFCSNVDKMEYKVRKFGGGAAESPIFIPELQGGWFNHYTVEHGYDDIYLYYGQNYTRTVVQSALAQGATMMSLYMFYGGTNWGNIGDPDVYTSYDYSACIREFGFLSGRGRLLRLTFGFVRSFMPWLAKTDAIDVSKQEWTLQCQPRACFNRARKTTLPHSNATFYFMRNFDKNKSGSYSLSLCNTVMNVNITMDGRLPYKNSAVLLGHYQIMSSLYLILSSVPILCRYNHSRVEYWFIQNDAECGGQLLFEGRMTVQGTMDAKIMYFTASKGQVYSLITPTSSFGWCRIQSSSNESLILIGMTGHDLYTLTPVFNEPWFGKSNAAAEIPSSISWGCHTNFLNEKTGVFRIECSDTEKRVYCLRQDCPPQFKSISQLDPSSPYAGLEYVWVWEAPNRSNRLMIKSIFTDLMCRKMNFNQFDWKPLPCDFKRKYEFKPTMDPLDFGFTSGHVCYKLVFDFKSERDIQTLPFDINMRHRLYLSVNGEAIGGHMTYSLQVFRAGSKIGPDLTFLGWKRYDIPHHLLKHRGNEIICIVESFGQNRQPFFFNDVRNRRGILGMALRGEAAQVVEHVETWISGVNVTDCQNECFNTSGFQDEKQEKEWQMVSHVESNCITCPLGTVPLYYKAHMTIQVPNQRDIPWRLHVQGLGTGYIWVNQMIIAKYYGNQSPQHDFYLMSGLLAKQNEIKIVCYTSHIDQPGDSTLTVTLLPWSVSKGLSDELDWSGNINEKSETSRDVGYTVYELK